MHFDISEIGSEIEYLDSSFSRPDESSDPLFYRQPRFVQHLDKSAIQVLEALIDELIIERNPRILDLMASWDSHLPDHLQTEVVGLGLNQEELNKNHCLNLRILHDLNSVPSIPFPDESFDIVLNTLSIGYLNQPFLTFSEVGRVLKPGGLFLVVFSNRLFVPKAVEIWSQATDHERILLVDDYFERSGMFEPRKGFASLGRPRPQDDKYVDSGLPSDPVFAVYADKSGGTGRPRPVPAKAGELPTLGDPHAIREKKLQVRNNLKCPYCDNRLQKVEMKYNPFSEWDTDHVLVCFNDHCPYLIRGWEAMFRQGNSGLSYRFMFHPYWKQCLSVPVQDLNALKNSASQV